ncbi:SDR family NAD(P)-dependent oxidoreductase [Parasphingopyxis algicola]|uniref:SDR family NAD(P)-dependent oxidoreductase n=1 Tax=Parasphingopyxis algicola TaxID=2026624 RepID=UPI0015A44409|nr:SDR family NAD(P)-dependent oxidoreductase [Parasphingopyxis algicola]QLC24043.1 SDR family NAD(P)-dependent oxidoreductase [Parasphingopyxis algicola]
MTKKLDGRLALVTGASRGIGAATAKALAAEGAHVILVARTVGGLEEVEEAIHEAGGNATIAPLDLVDGDSIARLAAAIGERWDALDILVLNAAILGSLTPVAQIEAKELSEVMTLNFTAQQALIAAFDPMLKKSERGHVIALTSSVGAAPRAFWGAYGASKAALDTLVAAYGEEVKNLAPLKVAIVDPGATATDMRKLAYPGEDQSALKPPEAVADAIVELATGDFETGHRTKVEYPDA